MRKLVCFTVGFVLACAIGAWWQDPGLLIAGLVLMILSLSCFFFSRQNLKRAALMLFGTGVGLIWIFGFLALTVQPVKDYDNQKVFLEAEIMSFSEETETGIFAEGKVMLDGQSYRADIYLHKEISLVPGDTLKGTFSVKLARDSYSLGQGVLLKVYGAEDVFVSQVEVIPFSYTAPLLRQRLLELLEGLFPEDTKGFAQALLLGERDALSENDTLILQSSGISHVVAVSGMHISILFGLIYELCRKRKWLSAIAGIPVLLLFTAINGFTPSATRACIMQIVLLVSLLADREYDPISSLSFAVLVILAVNPFSILHPGFQLSAGSMLGIFLFSGRIYQYFMDPKRLGRFKAKSIPGRVSAVLMKSFSVTLGAMIFTIPICAYHFSVISILSPVTNLLVLGLITVIFYGVLLCVAAGCIWSAAGGFLAEIISYPIRAVMAVAGFLGNLPGATVNAKNIYMLLWLIFAYGLLLLFLLIKTRKPLLLGACVAAGFLAATVFSYFENHYRDFQMTVLDVGQGQCIILQNDDHCYVVDCGGSSGAQAALLASTTLKDYGFSRIDGLILTHFDQDHIGGVLNLLGKVEVGTIYVPVLEAQSEDSMQILETEIAPIQYVTGQWELPVGDGTITLFPAEKGANAQESGLCVLFQMENCDILITGDRSIRQEQLLLEQRSFPDLEILIAGHHGSGDATGLPLLSATTPEVVIVSSGSNSGYDHPDPEFLRRVESFGCTVLRTDEMGTIIIRR